MGIEVEIEISQKALEIRKRVLKMAMGANGGHIAPAYSMADIVAELYFGGILKYDPQNPQWDGRDYFVLSKGHGGIALYAALSMAGFFPEKELQNFCKPGSDLGSLARRGSVPGIEASTGSLGHGLSFAAGIALALKKDHLDNRVFVLLGDGECEEGSVWEGLMFAVHQQLDNLTVIVDHNGLQAMDSLETIMSLRNFPQKFESFGFETVEIDGHDYGQIHDALNQRLKGMPKAVIANTVKGKGISFMENVPIWHYRVPNEEELKTALKELGMTREELGDYEKCLYRNII